MSMKSDLRTVISERDSLKSAKFALLAKVGQRKREALALHAEADSYSSTVTELVALSTGLLHLLEQVEPQVRGISPALVTLSSRHTHLMHHILDSLPRSSMSRDRVLRMLNSDGLETAMDITDDGYVSPSSDQILRNVARAIGIT